MTAAALQHAHPAIYAYAVDRSGYATPVRQDGQVLRTRCNGQDLSGATIEALERQVKGVAGGYILRRKP